MAIGQTRVDTQYGTITVEGVDRVVTGLFAFSREVTERLTEVIRARTAVIAQAERQMLAQHSRTGAQAGSVRTTVKAFGNKVGLGASMISGSVIVGGRKNVRQARVFEYGADWTVAVPEHTRERNGNSWSVKAYQMRFSRPAHEYLTMALQAEETRFSIEVNTAIGQAITSTGMA